MRPRSLALLAALLAGSPLALPSAARADMPAELLARALGRPGKRHPMADERGRMSILVPLPRGTDARALGLLPVAPGFGGIALTPSEVLLHASQLGLPMLAGPERLPLLDASGALTGASDYHLRTGHTGQGVVVGVIDTGFDLTHPDLRDENGKSRIRWLLQAGSPRGLHPELEDEYGCTDPRQEACAVLSGEDIDALLAEGDEELSARRAAHGTHVASIAAGNGGPMTGSEPRYVGVAPGAALILAAPSPPGGFKDAHILNATRFVFDRAEAMEMPAVVNLSVGGNFGGHDGTSALEQGLAAMVGEDEPGRVIVVAAGNSGSLYKVEGGGHAGIHTEVHVPPSATVRVPIRTGKAVQGQANVWITFRPGDEVSVGLEGPDGSTWVGLVEPGNVAGAGDDEGEVDAAVSNRVRQGKLAIEGDTNSAAVLWDGSWEAGEIRVLLRGKGDAQLWVTGQAEREDGLSFGLMFSRATRQGTVTIPASHPELLAVGCTVNRLAWTPFGATEPFLVAASFEVDSPCRFSSAGPTPEGVAKPEISAPGAYVAAAMAFSADPREKPGGMFDPDACVGDQLCYVVDDHHGIGSGTSMSAPQVAGAVALLLQRDPGLTQAQVTEILQAGARYPGGSVSDPTQLGPGALDVEGAMQVLDLHHARPVGEPRSPDAARVPADVARSWYVLSSSYARSDPTWPVRGLIELRRSDGTVAEGVEADALEVRVSGGLLLEGPSEVQHGMWSFAVAGPAGVYGTTLTVDVRYAGQSLGVRALPVGADVWAGSGEIAATSGGCTCTAAGDDRGQGRWSVHLLALLASAPLAALVTRRTRRTQMVRETPRRP
ncbi:S8 family serine peptidase [Chondromyces apiculatus]|uniref:Peptidase S8/S53 domain-containing protein n=1 Tax=Chondromyces apiculatus DSM 436 TaxID=1192034 RepID=A0A017SY93_9BACT|nr:S8 family serine peptidase [Chondromyces apiculatus]EYF01933.1 Hypothetical protein CAP_7701 [Chondromyces apiculatus DSM 436]